MKLGISIGILQMTFGILLKATNEIIFQDWISFFFEFIPQLLFFLSTFGYMAAQIWIKWIIDWS